MSPGNGITIHDVREVRALYTNYYMIHLNFHRNELNYSQLYFNEVILKIEFFFTK